MEACKDNGRTVHSTMNGTQVIACSLKRGQETINWSLKALNHHFGEDFFFAFCGASGCLSIILCDECVDNAVFLRAHKLKLKTFVHRSFMDILSDICLWVIDVKIIAIILCVFVILRSLACGHFRIANNPCHEVSLQFADH